MRQKLTLGAAVCAVGRVGAVLAVFDAKERMPYASRRDVACGQGYSAHAWHDFRPQTRTAPAGLLNRAAKRAPVTIAAPRKRELPASCASLLSVVARAPACAACCHCNSLSAGLTASKWKRQGAAALALEFCAAWPDICVFNRSSNGTHLILRSPGLALADEFQAPFSLQPTCESQRGSYVIVTCVPFDADNAPEACTIEQQQIVGHNVTCTALLERMVATTTPS